MFCEAGLRLFNSFKWRVFANKSGHVYLQRSVYAGKKNGRSTYKTVRLHRELLGLSDGDKRVSDHINGNTLDNRLENLRAVSPSANTSNRRLRCAGAFRVGAKWMARPVINGTSVYLGVFETKDAASHAYAQAIESGYGHKPRVESRNTSIILKSRP